MADDPYKAVRTAGQAAQAQKATDTTLKDMARQQASDVAKEGGTEEKQLAKLESIKAGQLAVLKVLKMNRAEKEKFIKALEYEKEETKELSDLQEKQLKMAYETMALNGKRAAAEIAQLEQQVAATDAAKENIKGAAEASKALYDSMEGVADQLVGIVSSLTRMGWLQQEGAFGAMDKAAKAAWESLTKFNGAADGTRAVLATLVKTSHKFVNAGLNQIVETTWKSFDAQMNAESALTKLTGTHGKYNEILKESKVAGIGIGATWEEQKESISALFSGMAEFSDMNADAAKKLAVTTTTLSRLGVPAETTASNINELTKVFGFNKEEAAKLSIETALLGKSIGISAGKMSKDFQQALPRLQLFGKQGTKIFKELAIRAKATGSEISDLTELAQGFDTFDSAIDKVNKLNQVLGGNYVNAVDLVGRTDEERLAILTKTLKMSGQMGEGMDHLTRKALMAIFPGKQYNALMKNVNMTEAERQKLAKKAEKAVKTAENMEKLREAALKAVPILTRLTNVFQTAFADPDMIKSIEEIVTQITEFVKMIGIARVDSERGFWSVHTFMGSWQKMLVWGIVLKGILGALTNFVKKGTLSILGKGVDKVAAGGKGIAALAGSAKDIMALGVAFLLLGAGVGLAAWGLSKFVASFEKLGLGQGAIAAAGSGGIFAAMAMSLKAAAKASEGAAKKLMPIAGVTLAIGLSVAIAAAGMSLFMHVLTESMPVLKEYIGDIFMLALAIGSMAIAFGAFAIIGGMSGVGLVLLAAGLTALSVGLTFVAGALRLMPEHISAPIAQGIGKGIENFGSGGGAAISGAAISAGAISGPTATPAASSGPTKIEIPVYMFPGGKELDRAVLVSVNGQWQRT
jgi:hypothetical protein